MATSSPGQTEFPPLGPAGEPAAPALAARPVSRGWLVLLVLLFVAGLLPFVARYVLSFPDERHYTDAGITMLRDGDLLTPKRADGGNRFTKPILTYWAVAGSYRLFGVSALTSRLPFLLAGAGVLVLTYQLGMLLLRDRRRALLAAAVMLAHPPLVLAATRSIPDVLMCLCLSLSLYGFVALLVVGRTEARFHWAAYLGLGLALATKGLLALALLGFVVAFAALTSWGWLGLSPQSPSPTEPGLPRTGASRTQPQPPPQARPGLRSLWHAVALPVGLALGAAWYVAVVQRHGLSALGTFWGDQVAEKINHPWLVRGERVLEHLVYYPLIFLPWFWLVADAWRRTRKQQSAWPTDPVRRRLWAFALAWAGLLPLLFGMGDRASTRYLLPAAPLLSVLVVDFLSHLDPGLLRPLLWRLLLTVLGVLSVVGLGLAWLHLKEVSVASAAALLVLLVGVTGLILQLARDPGCFGPAMALGLALFAAVPLLGLAAPPLAATDRAGVLAEQLSACGAAGDTPLLVLGEDTASLAARLRVVTGGRTIIRQADHLAPGQAPTAPVVIVDGKAANVDLSGYQTQTVPGRFGPLDGREVCRALWQGHIRHYLEAHREPCVIGVRTP